MAGEADTGDMARLIASGCRAVNDVAEARGLEIMTCVHLTDIQEPARIDEVLGALEKAGRPWTPWAFPTIPTGTAAWTA